MLEDKALSILESARQAEIERHKRELSDIDNAILVYKQRMGAANNGSEEQSSTPVVKRDQYRGMKAAQAMLMYLRERGGGPISRKEAATDLRLAGAEPAWTAERYERNVAIMLRNNADKFHYNEEADAVELAENKKRKLA